MTDTPETDAICKEYLDSYGGAIPVKFAQKLERERNEAIKMLEEYKLQYSDHELKILATCRNGMGELFPASAQREINRREIVNRIKNQES